MSDNKRQIKLDAELIQAVLKNDLSVVKNVIKKGANIHYLNELPLINAAENGNLDILKYLINEGANLSAREYAVLQAAASEGHLNVLRNIFETVYLFDLDRIQEILERINYLPIVYAIQSGHLNIIRYFMNTVGVDPESLNGTFLNEAVINNNIDIVRYLVENYQVYIPRAAISIAIRSGNRQLQDYLIEEAISMNMYTDEDIDFLFLEQRDLASPTDSAYVASPILLEPDFDDADDTDSDGSYWSLFD
jgi:ankyrin repeat protein